MLLSGKGGPVKISGAYSRSGGNIYSLIEWDRNIKSYPINKPKCSTSCTKQRGHRRWLDFQRNNIIINNSWFRSFKCSICIVVPNIHKPFINKIWRKWNDRILWIGINAKRVIIVKIFTFEGQSIIPVRHIQFTIIYHCTRENIDGVSRSTVHSKTKLATISNSDISVDSH